MKIYPAASISPAPEEHGKGVSIQWVVGRDQGAPNFAMRIIEVQPGGATPFHGHWNEHEVYVLEGRGVVRGAEGETPIAPGTVAYVAPDEEHQFVNVGEEPLRFICVVPIEKR